MDINKDLAGDNRNSLLDIQEVARILNVSRSMVYKLIEQGHLPSVKIGSAIRVRPASLDAFIDKNSVNA